MVVLSCSWDCENPINEGQNDHIQPVLPDFVHQQYLKAKHINKHISQAVLTVDGRGKNAVAKVWLHDPAIE